MSQLLTGCPRISLGQASTNSYYSFSSAVAGLFAFNLICTQFTVPVDAITVLLKTALPFRRNGTSFERPCNLHKVVNKRTIDATFPPFYGHCTIPKPERFCDGYCTRLVICSLNAVMASKLAQ